MNNLNFVALDFETANYLRSSVCAIGIAVVSNGVVVENKQWLVKPDPFEFDDYNIMIHGITPEDVQDKPKFNVVWQDVSPYLENKVLICHFVAFDLSVLRYTCDHFNMPYPVTEYTCTWSLSRKIWPGQLNYKLKRICKFLDIKFDHHIASEDAYAAAMIVIKACEKMGVNSIEELHNSLDMRSGRLLYDTYKPIYYKNQANKNYLKDLKPETEDFDVDSYFYDKEVVFTGTLEHHTRKEAMQKILNLGGRCKNNVTRSTNVLVIGTQDLRKFTEGTKSIKMKTAEKYAAEGMDIIMIDEDEFLRML